MKKIESDPISDEDSEQPGEWRTAKGERGLVFDPKEVEKMKQERNDRMRKELEIPADVKPGTANAVWYELRNAEILQKRRIPEIEHIDLRKAKNQRAAELAKKYNTERFMLDDCIARANVDAAFESTGKGQWEDDKKKKKIHENQLNSCSAREMYDLVRKHEIDPLEVRDTKLLTEGDKHMLEAAKDLLERLSKEILKSEQTN